MKHSEERREQWRAAGERYRQQHPERVRRNSRNGMKRRRAADPEKARARDRAYTAANPRDRRDYQLRLRYGITLEQWEDLFSRQGCVCGLCRSDKPGQRGWATDHDHETGRVRGILCHRCNLILGWLGDLPVKIEGAFARVRNYLTQSGFTPDRRTDG